MRLLVTRESHSHGSQFHKTVTSYPDDDDDEEEELDDDDDELDDRLRRFFLRAFFSFLRFRFFFSFFRRFFRLRSSRLTSSTRARSDDDSSLGRIASASAMVYSSAMRDD